jgi:hypothetical protein
MSLSVRVERVAGCEYMGAAGYGVGVTGIEDSGTEEKEEVDVVEGGAERARRVA